MSSGVVTALPKPDGASYVPCVCMRRAGAGDASGPISANALNVKGDDADEEDDEEVGVSRPSPVPVALAALEEAAAAAEVRATDEERIVSSELRTAACTTRSSTIGSTPRAPDQRKREARRQGGQWGRYKRRDGGNMRKKEIFADIRLEFF